MILVVVLLLLLSILVQVNGLAEVEEEGKEGSRHVLL